MVMPSGDTSWHRRTTCPTQFLTPRPYPCLALRPGDHRFRRLPVLRLGLLFPFCGPPGSLIAQISSLIFSRSSSRWTGRPW